MTTDSLRDLLHDRVADETSVDLSARAWRAGRRVRRRRGLAVVGGVTAGALAASGVVAWVGSTPPRDTSVPPAPATATPSPTEVSTEQLPVRALPGPRYEGARTWWWAGFGSEAGLPWLDGVGLPRRIDLDPGGPPAAGAGRVVALLGVVPDGPMSRVVAVGADGISRRLDVDRLDPVADEQGNAFAPVVSESLAPDGRRAFFVQERSLEVHDLVTGEWTTLATPPFLAEGAQWITPTEIWVPDDPGVTERGTLHDLRTGRQAEGFARSGGGVEWPGGEPFGPTVTTSDDQAQAVFLAEPATGPDGTSYGGLDAVAATRGRGTAMLVLGPSGERWKGCCPAVGLLDDTVLFESRSASPTVMAWDVGTDRVRRVAEITGLAVGAESYVTSWRVPLR